MTFCALSESKGMDISMIKRLEKTINLLEILNNTANVVSDNEIEEQKENLRTIIIFLKEFDVLLDSFEKIDFNDRNSIDDKLVKLHLKYCDLEWYIDEIHELVKKIAGNY